MHVFLTHPLSNKLTSYSFDNEGIVKKTYCPVHIFEIEKAPENHSKIFYINQDITYTFCDGDQISWFVTTTDFKQIVSVHPEVLLMYQKK